MQISRIQPPPNYLEKRETFNSPITKKDSARLRVQVFQYLKSEFQLRQSHILEWSRTSRVAEGGLWSLFLHSLSFSKAVKYEFSQESSGQRRNLEVERRETRRSFQ